MEQDGQRILAAARSMKPLQSLDIGGANFVSLKANKKAGSTLNKILAELVKLISAENSVSKNECLKTNKASLEPQRAHY
jgi:hypothetical protein